MQLLRDAQKELLNRSLDYQARKTNPDEDASKTTKFPIGTEVLALYPHNRVPRKHLTRWEGPFRVLSQDGSVVEVKHFASQKVSRRHVSAVKLLAYSGKKTEATMRRWAAKDKGEFEVESILNHEGNIKVLRNCRFFVKWQGFGLDDASWVPYLNVAKCEELSTYLAKLGVVDPEIARDKRIANKLAKQLKRSKSTVTITNEDDKVLPSKPNKVTPVTVRRSKRVAFKVPEKSTYER